MKSNTSQKDSVTGVRTEREKKKCWYKITKELAKPPEELHHGGKVIDISPS